MTWAPMYSAVVASDNYVISALDRDKVRNEGFLVKHRDGSRSNVTYKDLNVPLRSFWQIYSQRTYGFGPQVHRFAINEFGPYNLIEVNWNERLFNTLNKTLGYSEDDPKFITEITATKYFHFFEETRTNPQLNHTITDTLTIKINDPHFDPAASRPYLKELVE